MVTHWLSLVLISFDRSWYKSLRSFEACSVVKDVEEALVELFLPELTLGGDTDDHETLIWP